MKKSFLFNALAAIMLFGFAACNNTDEPKPDNGNGDEVAVKLPYEEPFATEIGKFTEQSVKGTQKWMLDSHGYMKMTGHVSANEKHENEDWLISPKIDMTNVSAAKLTFEYNCSFFTNLVADATVWVSENYKEGLPSTAQWTQLTVNLKSLGNWNIIPSDEISLTAYAGKKITIAFKYLSSNTDAGTWEIKNFKVQEGEAVVDPGGGDIEPDGDGTEASPYNVPGAMANQGAFKWVEGYIVGNIDGEGKSLAKESLFDGPFTIKTNMLIAANKDETDYNKCLPIQLPTGAIRAGLNLVDNETNKGKKVKLYGSLENYFGVPGVRNTSYYELEGGTTGGTKPVDTGDAIFAETLLTKTGFDKFTAVSVTGDLVWTHSTQYGAMMSGYKDGASHANEDWFISPAIDLAGKSNVNLSFEHARGPAGSMGVTTDYYTVWVTNNYTSGMPSTATWTQLTGVVHGTTAWGFVSSGNLAIPAANLNSNMRFAFKYLCTDAESATWEIKNIVLK